jgi:hypothetical protein
MPFGARSFLCCVGCFSPAPDLVAQHLRHEGHQLAQGGDVRYLPGRNVLDPADHAAWQLGAHVQVQDKGAVGEQFEPNRFRGRGWRGSNVPLLSHAPDSTGRRSHARWNRREIPVRRRLERGKGSARAIAEETLIISLHHRSSGSSGRNESR